jgi:hypothetical protein
MHRGTCGEPANSPAIRIHRTAQKLDYAAPIAQVVGLGFFLVRNVVRYEETSGRFYRKVMRGDNSDKMGKSACGAMPKILH